MPPLLLWQHTPPLLPLLQPLLTAAAHPYWLVRVEACALLGALPLAHVDHLQRGDGPHGGVGDSPRVLGALGGKPPAGGSFSHLVLTSALLPRLADADARVRSAACAALVRLVSVGLLLGDLLGVCGASQLLPGYLLPSPTRLDGCWSEVGGAALAPPYDALVARLREQQRRTSSPRGGASATGGADSAPPPDALELLRRQHVDDSLSRLVHLLTTTLFTTTNKIMKGGCVQALSELAHAYPPVLYLSLIHI
ncbi:uncharacterized protein LOC125177845 [Hyalella azteca]|uniref:Uncharacterized protein LOC125177845 n=1 Tax=Hyalella azteca TaxID=294128 RepID=A0A979FH84_HYAAZ|nr:uncharacterized protein LOC125177845 [Hyalella azteca]